VAEHKGIGEKANRNQEVVMKKIMCGVMFASLVSSVALAQGENNPSSSGKKGNVSIEAGLIMQNGTVRRVARAELHLVTSSVAALLMNHEPEGLSHYKFPGGRHEDMEINTFCSITHSPRFAQLLKEDQPRRVDAALAALPDIAKSTVATAQTDFDGKTSFANVPAGKYWVFGCYEIGSGSDRQSVNWNVPVTVVAGVTNSLVLDQNNKTGN
jgi:hypothetical protein